MSLLAQSLISGAGTGAVYALIAYGIVMVWMVTRTLNFAHGDVLMVGVFISFVSLFMGTSVPVAILLSVAASVLLGIALEKSVFYPLRKRPQSLAWVLGVVVFAGTLRSIGILLFESRSYPAPFSFDTEAIAVAGAVIPGHYVWIIPIALVTAIGLDRLLTGTNFGRALRAIAESRDVATLMGVETERVMTIAFGVAAGVGTLAGLLIAPVTFVSTSLGWMFTLKGFTAAMIGGVASARGALVGGFILGMSEQLLAALSTVVPGRFLEAGFRDAYVFLALVAVLVLRPQGILGNRPARFADA